MFDTMNFLRIPIMICLLAAASCKKDNGTVPPPTIPPPAPETFNYSSDRPRNLNVVYFIPDDVSVPADHHRRISEILLSAQDFFGKEMQRNGYGYKTFGLVKDDARKRIRLIEIKAKQGKSAYPYNGGAGAVQSEIAAFKTANPSLFTSDHYLVIIPAYTYDASGEPGGPPFYGVGKTCFALDYADQDIKYLGAGGTLGTRATKWIGGMIHELGHGLNLPHNRQKAVSEQPLGMALMWAGNSTWGRSATFLTSADCAVLNNNQVFNNDTQTYYTSVTAGVQRILANYDDATASIRLRGRFSSGNPVKDILYFHDPNVNNEGTGVNRDYNAIAWISKPIGSDSFAIDMPIADLVERADNIPYELKVKLAHENGEVSETIYSYTFLAGKPSLNFSTRNELSKQGWRISSFSSEETAGEGTVNGRAATLIDGLSSTFWHSRWTSSPATYPHWVVIDMGTAQTASGISLTQRSGLARAIKEADLLVSSDGISFTKVSTLSLANQNGVQYHAFTSPITFRFFRLEAKSAWDGLQFASLAEIGLY